MRIAQPNSNSWYVSFRHPEKPREHYARSTKIFRTEEEARNFAAALFAEGCEVTAGTLTPPYLPRKVIGPSDIPRWIERHV